VRFAGLFLVVLAAAAQAPPTQLVFDNAFGPSSISAANGIAVDAWGNFYVVATISDPFFTHPAGDISVTKWDPTGSETLYSTYIGSPAGDYATGIAVDTSGAAYILGVTTSSNFPTTAGALQTVLAGAHNAFIVKLSPDGSRVVYSTLMGGGTEFTAGIAVDASGGAYITGSVQSNLPATRNAFQKTPGGACTVIADYVNYPTTGDAFVAKISPDGGTLAYASYLGGQCADSGYGITANGDGSIWVAGITSSPDFPVTPDALQPQYGGGFSSGFLAQVSAAGDSLTHATYLGGSGNSQISAIAQDASGNLYLTGGSSGFLQPASPGAFEPSPPAYCLVLGIGPPLYSVEGSAFVMKLNPSATALTGLTYIGSPCYSSGSAIAVDSTGAPWIAGTPSPVFPTASPFRIQSGGGFVSKFSPDLTQLLFSTYTDYVAGLALDAAGQAYIAGFVTSSQPGNTAYVAKIDAAPVAVSLDNILGAGPFPAQEAAEMVAPGKVIRIVGKGMAPAGGAAGIISAGTIATSAGGVQVTFDGVPAPLLYANPTEIECITPFALAGQTATTVQVTYNGANSNPVAVPVWSSAPDVLVALNSDFTVNSPTNPAKAGSVMELYVTGGGQTNPPSTDGEIYTDPLPQPVGAVTVLAGSPNNLATFAAAAYGLAAGILQVNFQAPAQSEPGVRVQVGSAASSFAVYVQ
jgi:uncharacterized protein (TIGR03437 family)